MHRTGRPTAAELVSKHYPRVLPGSTVAAAAQILASSGLPMVPVCHSDGRLAGVVTDRAILACVAANSAVRGQLVDDVMDSDPAFVADYATVEWILVEMDDAHTWSLPVTDARHHMVGVINLPDLTREVFPDLLVWTWNRIAVPHGD